MHRSQTVLDVYKIFKICSLLRYIVLKVLKLESAGGGGTAGAPGKDANTSGGADGGRGTGGAAGGGGGSNLSMNQTLEGHEGSVVCEIPHHQHVLYSCAAKIPCGMSESSKSVSFLWKKEEVLVLSHSLLGLKACSEETLV